MGIMPSHMPVPARADQQIAVPPSGEGAQAVSVVSAAVSLSGNSGTDLILWVHSYNGSSETL